MEMRTEVQIPRQPTSILHSKIYLILEAQVAVSCSVKWSYETSNIGLHKIKELHQSQSPGQLLQTLNPSESRTVTAHTLP